MKLAVSNIAWSPADRATAYGLMRARGITGLEIAPSLLFAEAEIPLHPTDRELALAVEALRAAKLQPISMQSLLFGAPDAELFGTPDRRDLFMETMLGAIALAGSLAIGNIVFGSPRQRNIPEGMSEAEAVTTAIDTFGDLGDAAAAVGTRIGIEANPRRYGTNFLNTIIEASDLVRKIGHPAVTLTFDIGAVHVNGEFEHIEAIIEAVAPHIGHVHMSEPDLGPAPASVEAAARAMSALDRFGYAGWYSVEMKTAPERDLAGLEGALDRFCIAAERARVGL